MHGKDSEISNYHLTISFLWNTESLVPDTNTHPKHDTHSKVRTGLRGPKIYLELKDNLSLTCIHIIIQNEVITIACTLARNIQCII